ncbi:glutamine amidotransferase [Marilutibacter chinensis]|uniref:Glutamine amidotransferase n=1 Tax=Marilutibacter chinensis TaxID=2912247 RepID=A0ABS9HTW5_9GAMM|nr:glutamine amidotransferase [Lysobacter chinensis]MCF7221748.1 glutamine amidotransferase [Lysobacter chinensis]
MTTPFLIVETGQPVASLRRHRGFPHWIRVAAGLHPDDAMVVNVEAGEVLPPHDAGPGFSGVIVTGSAAMVSDRADWSERTAAWLADAAQARVPVFGICYGHQLLAHALGGEVGDHPRGREMGTVEIHKASAADGDPLFGTLPDAFPAQATHLQSVLRAPDGATVLAHNGHEPCHAFRWGDRAWGVQFHPEFSVTHMRGYIRARHVTLAREGRDPAALLGAVGATPHARRVLRRFVHHARGLHRA